MYIVCCRSSCFVWNLWTLVGIAWAGASSNMRPTMIVPNFKPPQSEGAGRGLVPYWGPGSSGADLLHPPPPTLPNRSGTKWVTDPTQPPHPRPPTHPFAPSLQGGTSRARPLHSQKQGGRRRSRTLGFGTRMVTQQVVLRSQTTGDDKEMSEQVDSPSHRTRRPPPPPLPSSPPPPLPCAPGGGNGVGALWAWVAVKGSQLDRCEYPAI